MNANKGSVLGATSLVAGTCIGGGMLALPVATGAAGFFSSSVMILLGWAFMTITALLLLEANLWMEKDAHVLTMAGRFLGPVGKVIALLLYLFISYASLVAYSDGGGQLLNAALDNFLGIHLTWYWGEILFVALFGGVIYLGNVFVGRINTLLMIGLVVSYVLLIGTGMSEVNWRLLLRNEWGSSFLAIPLLLTIFSFQTIVPSLTIYLKQDAKALRLSIILGTTISLIVYLIWEWLVLGTVLYDGDMGLAKALETGKPITEFLSAAVQNPMLQIFADFFAFFAIVTSFLGIALGLFDFLADGLKIKRGIGGNLILGLLIAIPTLFFIMTLEKVFLLALDTSGGIGDSLLNGVFPALMVWVGRYKMQLKSEYRVPGGKGLIFLVIVYALFVFALEILGKFGIIDSLT